MRLVVIGNIGSDAGYWVLGPDGKWHHQGGWGIEAVAEVQQAVQILAQTARLKTPGLAEGVSGSLMKFVEKEVGANIKGSTGDVIVVMGH